MYIYSSVNKRINFEFESSYDREKTYCVHNYIFYFFIPDTNKQVQVVMRYDGAWIVFKSGCGYGLAPPLRMLLSKNDNTRQF